MNLADFADVIIVVSLIVGIVLACVLFSDDDGKALSVATALAVLSALTPGDAAAVCGAPGSGKSHVVSQAVAHRDAVIIFDPYARRDRLNAARAGGSSRVVWAGDLVSVTDLASDVLRSQKHGTPSLLDVRPLRLVVASSNESDPDAMGAEFSRVVDLAWATGGGVVVVGEEASLYSRHAVRAILQATSGGAHGGVIPVLVSQSFGRLHKDARRHVSLVAQGPLAEESDRKCLCERAGKDFVNRASAIQPRAPFVWWRVGGTSGE